VMTPLTLRALASVRLFTMRSAKAVVEL
jgi:hypothetical protein